MLVIIVINSITTMEQQKPRIRKGIYGYRPAELKFAMSKGYALGVTKHSGHILDV